MIEIRFSDLSITKLTKIEINLFQLSILEEDPNNSETVLQHLLQLTSKEGMCLPQRTTSNGVSASHLSINTATDDSEQANQNLWDNITMKLRRYFIDKLTKLPVGVSRPIISGGGGGTGDERLRYLHSLCSLFPVDDIWQRYKNLRIHQLDTCLLSCKQSGSSKEQHTFMRSVSHFSCQLLPRVQRMVHEDYQLLNSGVFGGSISTLQALQELYTERLMEEVTATVGILQHEMTEGITPPKRHSKDTNHTKVR